ncbi:MAG: 2'-5' RNA ligase family protein [Candidatus Marinimicrobia bacterium]|nr:2'-5' RNA ligase family protein [Candidatus Neomarinimicrobiota bacterium]
MGHSIWLIPGKPEFEYLQNLIIRFSDRTDTPKFPPHITLLGQLPQNVDWIKARMIDFFHGVNPFQLRLSHIGMFNHYFRSIIMHTHLNPDLELLHMRAGEHFKQTSNNSFMPHLSLLYSNLDLIRKKQLMESMAIGSPLILTIQEAALVETQGDPDQWREIVRIPFS